MMVTQNSTDKGFTVNDKRWWLREDAGLDTLADQARSRKPTYVEELETKVANLERQILEVRDAHRSSKADLEEVRKRLERDLDQRLAIQRARLAEPFLEVVENLGRLIETGERATDAAPVIQGAKLLQSLLEERLRALGLVSIQAAGQRFDPARMEALATAEVAEAEDGLVLDVLRPGFLLEDRLVRPAGVRVGVAPRREES